MPNLSWRDAVIEILKASPEAMHYADIAEQIAERELRTEFGATPAISVNVAISSSLQKDGTNSPFVRVSEGTYWLRALWQTGATTPPPPVGSTPSTTPDAGLINAFGMYWSRHNVLWTSPPKILGQQQLGSTAVDFCGQHGVYLLHDARLFTLDEQLTNRWGFGCVSTSTIA